MSYLLSQSKGLCTVFPTVFLVPAFSHHVADEFDQIPWFFLNKKILIEHRDFKNFYFIAQTTMYIVIIHRICTYMYSDSIIITSSTQSSMRNGAYHKKVQAIRRPLYPPIFPFSITAQNEELNYVLL